MRRADSTAGEDDLANRGDALDQSAAREFDRDRALAVEHDAVHQRAGYDRQVLALQALPWLLTLTLIVMIYLATIRAVLADVPCLLLTAFLCGPFFYPVFFASFLHAFDYFVISAAPGIHSVPAPIALPASVGDPFPVAATSYQSDKKTKVKKEKE